MSRMKMYSCEIHINQALDVFVAEEETFPIMVKVKEEEKLSTKCEYCDTPASYLVANE
ncbi:CxxH/CxxC protein (TIGR04129 family) [Sporosarcina luteola]|nr:CxxH/CxxC protein (TIGR04129 family) [Sporosarcina luteola]